MSTALRPEYPIRTARLELRPLSRGDVAHLVSYRSLPEVCRYVPFAPMGRPEIEARLGQQWARTTIEAEADALVLGVELVGAGDRAGGTLIGDVMLRFTSAEHRCGELGYVLNPAYSGRGYATEAAHAVLHLAFDGLGAGASGGLGGPSGLGLHRVVARVDARNLASARLATRLGMRQEAHLVENEWFKGEWSDELDFALLEQEWRDQPHEGCPSVSPPR